MKSVAEQISITAENLKRAGHTVFVNEVLGQDCGKQLEGKLVKLTTFAESTGVATREAEQTARANLVEAAMKSFGLTKEEAERFARPTSYSVEPKWADLLKETK